MAFNLLMYETPNGQPVIQKYIASLQATTKAKLARQIDLLAAYGPELGMPHVKPLKAGLYELQVRGDQEVRVLYVYATGNDIYLLHAFQKKSQTTPKRELDIARQRQTEIQ